MNNYENYKKRLLNESLDSRRIVNGEIHRNENLKKLEELRKNNPSVAAVLNMHFDDDETTFEEALINLIGLLCDETKIYQEGLARVLKDSTLIFPGHGKKEN